MPDITLCINKECFMREKCYRFKAKPSLWQSFTHFVPAGKDDCIHYIPLGENNVQN